MAASQLSESIDILLVSSKEIILENLQNSIHSLWKEQKDDRQYSCNVHICPNFELDQAKRQIKFDFLVFIIDATLVNCLQEVEESLTLLDGSFGRHKICLVAQGVSYSSATSPEMLWKFAQVYQFPLLIEDATTPDNYSYLSERLLNLVEVSCGVSTGFPLVGKV